MKHKGSVKKSMKSGPGGLQASIDKSVREPMRKTRKFSRGCELMDLGLQASRQALDKAVKETERKHDGSVRVVN